MAGDKHTKGSCAKSCSSNKEVAGKVFVSCMWGRRLVAENHFTYTDLG